MSTPNIIYAGLNVTQYAEDSQHTSGDKGILGLTVRKDTATQISGTDGDYSVLITDASGRLHVNVGNTVNVAQSGTWNLNNISGTISLPTGAATESTLSTLNGKITECDTGSVAITSALPVGSNHIGIISIESGQIIDTVNTITNTVTVDNAGTFATQSSNYIDVASIATAQTGITVGSANAAHVAIVDGSGNQITSFNGGIQYTENDAVATHPIAPTLLWSDGTLWNNVSNAAPLPCRSRLFISSNYQDNTGVAAGATYASHTAIVDDLGNHLGNVTNPIVTTNPANVTVPASSAGSAIAVAIVDDTGNQMAGSSNPIHVNAGNASIPVSGATVALPTVILDGSGNQITSFGGGTQYTTANTAPADPSGPTLLFENGAGNWEAIGSNTPLPITIQNIGSNTISVGNGTQDSGTIRVTIASDTSGPGSAVASPAYTGIVTNISGTPTYVSGMAVSGAVLNADIGSSYGLVTNSMTRFRDASSGDFVNNTGKVTVSPNVRAMHVLPTDTLGTNISFESGGQVKISPYLGTTQVSTGNGVVGAGVQRVAIASDNTAFSVNATLANETTKVIGTVNIAAAQTLATVTTVTNLSQLGGTAIAMNSGARSAGTQRVTIATDDKVPMVGTVAHDSPNADAPVKIGGKATTSLPSAVSASADIVDAWFDRHGSQLVRAGNQAINAWTAIHTGGEPAVNTQATCTQAAPGAGLKNIVTSISATIGAGSTAPTAVQLYVRLVEDAAGTPATIYSAVVCLPAVAGANAGVVLSNLWIPVTTNKSITLRFSAAGGANTYQAVHMTGVIVAE